MERLRSVRCVRLDGHQASGLSGRSLFCANIFINRGLPQTRGNPLLCFPGSLVNYDLKSHKAFPFGEGGRAWCSAQLIQNLNDLRGRSYRYYGRMRYVILEQNHIAARQYHVISLREIRKCTAFSADTRGRVSLQHRMLQMMIDGAVEAPVGTPLPGCPVILEQNHIAARRSV